MPASTQPKEICSDSRNSLVYLLSKFAEALGVEIRDSSEHSPHSSSWADLCRIHDHSGLALRRTEKPRQMVNLSSILLSEPVSVCGPGHPRTSKTKLEKDTWVVYYVRETSTCRQTIRIRTLSFVNKLWFFTKSWHTWDSVAPLSHVIHFSSNHILSDKHVFCLALPSPQDLE